MKFLVIGDVHFEVERLRRLLRLAPDGVEAVLFVGDLADGGHVRSPRPREAWEADVREVLSQPQKVLGVPSYAVPGNHDQKGLPVGVDLDGVLVGGPGRWLLGGLGGAGPARFGFPYEWSEDEAREALARYAKVPPAVLVSHAPPYGVRDLTRSGARAGSEALAEWATAAPPGVIVCGHIHEDAGVGRIGDRLVLNAGALGRPYGADQFGVVEITDGTFSVEHVVFSSSAERKVTGLRWGPDW